jgi:starch phosphorylase
MDFKALSMDNYSVLKKLVQWKKKIQGNWGKIRIVDVDVSNDTEYLKGKNVKVQVRIYPAGHGPDEFKVELLHGPIDLWDKFKTRNVKRLDAVSDISSKNGDLIFKGEIPLTETGLYGYGVRVTPQFPALPSLEWSDSIIRG